MHLIDELSDQFHTYSMIGLGPMYSSIIYFSISTMYSSFIYKKLKTYSKNPILAGSILLQLCTFLKIGSTHLVSLLSPY